MRNQAYCDDVENARRRNVVLQDRRMLVTRCRRERNMWISKSACGGGAAGREHDKRK